ncbi:hypothetical protein MPTK1_3g17710 [Marchantia polymorpha subsp. ruderalis]|uniref:Uncharacterized protein n=2 Tax=Marchantia polymorpha TaxID=3197 RepID=A0AAF6B1Y2_MARPO|nr:hypothetical protein MARPO_0039s0025 [Marchantia polymorpha]BBN06016.1 hypothetical protein Mp_3g17710 [Marchantia polymorpha subsp. ruderalis]|eukprot:PTQ40512.1 hypothetical protein MARPO_0039s0025 [Marchantia polymorpha]
MAREQTSQKAHYWFEEARKAEAISSLYSGHPISISIQGDIYLQCN